METEQMLYIFQCCSRSLVGEPRRGSHPVSAHAAAPERFLGLI